jgi:hypothetical protein
LISFSSGHRFRPIHDFGYVALDVIDLIPEDSGVYTCRATNLVGRDEKSARIQVHGEMTQPSSRSFMSKYQKLLYYNHTSSAVLQVELAFCCLA